MSQEQARPGHATLAGSIIVGCSIIVVLSAWERISTLHTLEVQEEIQRTLADPPMSGLGLSVDGYTDLLRVLCLIGAGAATAAAILGVQVFKRSVSARIALTALSPLILVGGIAAGAFFGPLVVAGITLLWLQPTRDWYAGRPWTQGHEQRRAERLADLRPPRDPQRPDPFAQAPVQSPAQAPVQSPVQAPTPVPPATGVAQPGPGAAVPPPHDRPFGEPFTEPVAQHRRPDAVRRARPQALVAACVLTWATSSLVLLGLVVMAAMLPSQADELLADFNRQEPQMADAYQFTEGGLMAAVYVFLVGFALWTVAAMVLAGLAFIGQNWARITLVVSAVAAGLIVLVMAIGAWPLFAVVAVFAVCVRMLLRPEVGRWYQR